MLLFIEFYYESEDPFSFIKSSFELKAKKDHNLSYNKKIKKQNYKKYFPLNLAKGKAI